MYLKSILFERSIANWHKIVNFQLHIMTYYIGEVSTFSPKLNKIKLITDFERKSISSAICAPPLNVT